jgi:hypothetical protein
MMVVAKPTLAQGLSDLAILLSAQNRRPSVAIAGSVIPPGALAIV